MGNVDGAVRFLVRVDMDGANRPQSAHGHGRGDAEQSHSGDREEIINHNI